MAVEARHHNIFSPQLLVNREIMNPIEASSNIYNTQLAYGLPLSGATATETLLPVYGSVISDSIPQKPVVKSDSTLTYNKNNNNLPLSSRKRSRDSINPLFLYPSIQTQKSCTPFSFLGQDISVQIQEQQYDIDRLISQHMEKVRIEVEDRRKRQARRIMDAIEEGMMKKLKEKEEEIDKIGKLNWALEERVKSLCVENQIWRDLAQTNEATANALRSNLEQVFAAAAVVSQTKINDCRTPAQRLDEEVIDDAQSCCGSTWEGYENNKLAVQNDDDDNMNNNKKNSEILCDRRLCRNCRKEESRVLLLPCRHLCLCSVCGSSLHTCPVCKSEKTVSVHVNMS